MSRDVATTAAAERVTFRVTAECPEPAAAQPRTARLGVLHSRREGVAPVETPAVLLDSLGVSPAYLTPDLARKLPSPSVVSAVHLGNAFTAHQHLAKMLPPRADGVNVVGGDGGSGGSGGSAGNARGGALAALFALQGQSMVYLTPRPDAATGIFGAPLDQPAAGDEYAFETARGRRRVTLAQYLDVAAACGPDLFAVLAQEPPAGAPRKKHAAALQQNGSWLRQAFSLLGRGGRESPATGGGGAAAEAAAPAVGAVAPSASTASATAEKAAAAVAATAEAPLPADVVAAWEAIRASAPNRGGDAGAAGSPGSGSGGGGRRQRKRKLGAPKAYSAEAVAALRAQAGRERDFLATRLGCTDRVSTRRMRQRLARAVHERTATSSQDDGSSSDAGVVGGGGGGGAPTARAASAKENAAALAGAAALAVVTGGCDVETWRASARLAAESPADGFVLGFNGGAAADGSGDAFRGADGRGLFEEVLAAAVPVLRAGTGAATAASAASAAAEVRAGGGHRGDRLLLAEGGADSPHKLLRLVASGVDLVSCALPVRSTRAHRALVFPMLADGAQAARTGSSSSGSSGGGTGGTTAAGTTAAAAAAAAAGAGAGSAEEPAADFLARMDAFTEAQEAEDAAAAANDGGDPEPWRDALFADSSGGVGGAAAAGEARAADLFGSGGGGGALRVAVDLFDKRFERDTRPLVAGCTCHACQHHTRAYIYHLLNVKESLAFILLHVHNTHHLDTFMAGLRAALGSTDVGVSADAPGGNSDAPTTMMATTIAPTFWDDLRAYSRLRFEDEHDPMLMKRH